MTYSIYIIKDCTGDELGLLRTDSFLDIIDVRRRASNKFDYEESELNIEYVGDVD